MRRDGTRAQEASVCVCVCVRACVRVREQGRGDSKSGKYVCVLCNCAFGKLKNFNDHIRGRQHVANGGAIEDLWHRFTSVAGACVCVCVCVCVCAHM